MTIWTKMKTIALETFPHRTLQLFYFEDVKNVESIMQQLRSGQLEVAFMSPLLVSPKICLPPPENSLRFVLPSLDCGWIANSCGSQPCAALWTKRKTGHKEHPLWANFCAGWRAKCMVLFFSLTFFSSQTVPRFLLQHSTDFRIFEEVWDEPKGGPLSCCLVWCLTRKSTAFLDDVAHKIKHMHIRCCVSNRWQSYDAWSLAKR